MARKIRQNLKNLKNLKILTQFFWSDFRGRLYEDLSTKGGKAHFRCSWGQNKYNKSLKVFIIISIDKRVKCFNQHPKVEGLYVVQGLVVGEGAVLELTKQCSFVE